MTNPGPLDFLYKNPVPASSNVDANLKQNDPLGFLYQKPKEQATDHAQGFVDYISNVSKNWIQAGASKSATNVLAMLDPLSSSRFATDPSVGMAASDLGKVFDHIFQMNTPINAAIEIGKTFGAGSGSGSKITPSGLAIGMITPVTDLMELSSGLKLSEDDPRSLTPEEKAGRIKNTVGLIAASAVAGPLSAAIDAPVGALGSRLLSNATVGAVAGGVYGGVGAAGDKDQLAQIISNGVMGAGFGSLGAAKDLLFGKNANLRPEEVAQIRQTQIEDNTPASTIKLAQALATNDDLAGALIEGKVGLQKGDIHIVPGVDPSKLELLDSKILEGYRSVMHIDKDGVGNLLVHDESSGIDEKFYQQHGVLKDQSISYLGQDHWSVKDAQGDMIKLQNQNDPSSIIEAHKNDVRLLPNVILDRAKATAGLYDEWKSNLETQVPQAQKLLGNTNSNLPIENQIQQALIKLPANNHTPIAITANGTEVPLLDHAFGRVDTTTKEVLLADGKTTLPVSAIKQIKDANGNIIFDTSKSTTVPPRTIDNSEPARLIDKVPAIHNVDIQKNLNSYLQSKGFSGDDLNSLKRDIELKFAKEVHAEYLEPEEAAIIAKAKSTPITQADKLKTWQQLNRVAKSNGFNITDGGSGRVVVRDLDGKILKGFDNQLDAAKWMNKTNQANGVKLDDNSTMPSEVAGGGMPPLPPEDDVKYASDQPYNYMTNKKNWGESVLNFANNFALGTRYRDFMLKIDSDYGTKLSQIHDNVSLNKNKRNARWQPYAEELSDLQKSMRKMTPAQRERIGDHMQSMSPQEVIERSMPRVMTSFEVTMGNRIAQSGVDVERIFNYRREIPKIDNEFPIEKRQVDPAIEQQYQQRIQEAKQAFAIDPEHQKYSDLFDQIETMRKDDAAIGPIVQLARTITNKGLTQAEFAAHSKMGLDEVMVSNRLTNMYQRLAKEFGINPKSILGQYMTHAKLLDGDVGAATRQYSGDVKTRDFYAKLSRTGEISAYERDPIKAMLRYQKAGFDVNAGFADAITNGKNTLSEELNKIADDGTRKKVQEVVGRYMDDVQSFPGATTRAAQEFVQRTVGDLGFKNEINVSAWVNAATSLMASAGLGARPMLGIGHFGISTLLSTSERSHSYTGRVLAAGAKALTDRSILQELQEKGVMSGLSPIAVMSAAEYGSTAKGLIRQGQDALFKASLLPTVYDGFAAGHYLTTNADALAALTKFSRGEMTWKGVKKATFLDKYDAPVMEHFSQLAADPNTHVAAADYLGRQAIEDLVGTYGAGNHPYLWGTNTGKILGQFGNFAMFVRGSVTRTLSRGTIGQRIGSAAKLVGYSAALAGLSEESGIDLNRMSPFHAMTWMLGPAAHIALDATDAIRATGYVQQAAQNRLMKMIPIDKDGNFQPSLLLPGSFAIDGMIKAATDFNDNALVGGAEALGFKKTQGALAPQF